MDDRVRSLLSLARRKQLLDETRSWSQGSETYLGELRKELVEVEEALASERQAHIEDELGDVLWDYLCVLVNLEAEGVIVLDEVFRRSQEKYDERISGIEQGVPWAEVKARQKRRLE